MRHTRFIFGAALLFTTSLSANWDLLQSRINAAYSDSAVAKKTSKQILVQLSGMHYVERQALMSTSLHERQWQVLADCVSKLGTAEACVAGDLTALINTLKAQAKPGFATRDCVSDGTCPLPDPGPPNDCQSNNNCPSSGPSVSDCATNNNCPTPVCAITNSCYPNSCITAGTCTCLESNYCDCTQDNSCPSSGNPLNNGSTCYSTGACDCNSDKSCPAANCSQTNSCPPLPACAAYGTCHCSFYGNCVSKNCFQAGNCNCYSSNACNCSVDGSCPSSSCESQGNCPPPPNCFAYGTCNCGLYNTCPSPNASNGILRVGPVDALTLLTALLVFLGQFAL